MTQTLLFALLLVVPLAALLGFLHRRSAARVRASVDRAPATVTQGTITMNGHHPRVPRAGIAVTPAAPTGRA